MVSTARTTNRHSHAQPRSSKPRTAAAFGLETVGTSVIEPDAEGLLSAVARIGYELEIALADLIDNSIDAGAETVLIRFYRTNGGILALSVVDDGKGMSESQLDVAMGFGRNAGKGFSDLGKYGMGLKAASFSQSTSVAVMTTQASRASGRRWTIDNIRDGWLCDHIAPEAVATFLQQPWEVLKIIDHGTAVFWNELDAFRVAKDQADGVLEKYFRRVSMHLGLHFHRYLSSGKLRIFLDALNLEDAWLGAPRPVEPLDPFSYPASGHRNYPRAYSLEVPNVGPLVLESHIWPPRSKLPGYVLGGGRVAQRQGFYFYRNDRLIQAGGWNGWREAEPHSSLARVAVNLPAQYDHAFGLNVQKSAVSVPAGFLEALPRANSETATFDGYIRDAIETYRTRPRETHSGEVLSVPSGGITRQLAAEVKSRLVGNSRLPTKRVGFKWSELPSGQLFQLDRERDLIWLNKRYRGAVVATDGGLHDGALVKMLLFLLLQGDLDRERDSASSRSRVDRYQDVLVAAARDQLG